MHLRILSYVITSSLLLANCSSERSTNKSIWGVEIQEDRWIKLYSTTSTFDSNLNAHYLSIVNPQILPIDSQFNSYNEIRIYNKYLHLDSINMRSVFDTLCQLHGAYYELQEVNMINTKYGKRYIIITKEADQLYTYDYLLTTSMQKHLLVRIRSKSEEIVARDRRLRHLMIQLKD